MLTSPPSSSSASSSADSTALSFAAASPVCELCASSAITANRLPWVAASSRTASSANGNVWIVQTTIFLSPDSASASSPLLLPPSPLIVATTPVVRSKSKIASCSCVSITLRSETTSTVSNTFWCCASCRSARKCAVQAMEFVLPEPAECWIRYLPPGPSRQHRRLQLARGVELVEAREDDALDLLLLVPLGDQVAAEDLQPALALPRPAPTGRPCGGRLRVHGIALPPPWSPWLNGRNAVAGPSSRVVMWTSLLLTAKCTSAPLGKRQQRLGGLPFGLRLAVEAVLVDRVVDALGEVGLQLDRGHRQAVEEQHEVDAVLVVQRVAHLPHDAQAVGGVAGEDVRVHRQRRLELRQLQRLPQAEQLDAVPQHVERAALVELSRGGGSAASRRPARRGS